MVDSSSVVPPLAKRIATILSATVFLAIAGGARADDQTPKTFTGHGVSFSYPGSWIEIPATFEFQMGSALWTESVGPVPPVPAPQAQPAATPPATTHPDLVTLASYHISVALTRKNIGRYKQYIAASVAQFVAQAHGQVLAGPVGVTMARLPGYAFQVIVQTSDGTLITSRIVFVFRKKTEYFLNCEYPQNDPLGGEIDSGCDQIMQSFRLAT